MFQRKRHLVIYNYEVDEMYVKNVAYHSKTYLYFRSVSNEILQGNADDLSDSEKDIERVLRPIYFDDFAGQDKI